MTPALKLYVQSWLRKAENDLISAQRLLEIEPMILDNACFHFQQAVEKYLKAYLTYNVKDFSLTHNIIFLLDECSKIDPVSGSVDPLDLNNYSVQGRYPDSNLMPTAEEAKGFYKLTLKVKGFVTERVVFS